MEHQAAWSTSLQASQQSVSVPPEQRGHERRQPHARLVQRAVVLDHKHDAPHLGESGTDTHASL